MYCGQAEVGVGGIDYQDLTRQEVEEETTGTYARRVLEVNASTPAPLPLNYDLDAFSGV